MLSKSASAAAVVARSAVSRSVLVAAQNIGAVRWQSKGKKAKKTAEPAAAPAASTASVADVLAENSSPEALTNLFNAYDVANPDAGAGGVVLPITVSGPHAQWVEVAYAAAGELNKDAVKGLSTLNAQLQTFTSIVTGSDYGIFRFFTEADHLPSENVVALNLLLTGDEPLKSLDSIADAEIKEYFVADEPTLAAWKDARAAIKAAKLSPQALSVLTAMAGAGQSFRMAKVLEALTDILAAVSPVAEVTVSSAVELTAAQKKDVVGALPAYLPANKKETNVSYTVDASLTGGLVVAVDSMTIDLSATSILVAAATAAQSGEGRL